HDDILASFKYNDKCALSNKLNGRRGNVIVGSIERGKNCKLIPCYTPVHPIDKDFSRYDGIAMPALSPRSLGPVVVGDPSKNGLRCEILHNFWASQKVMPDEVD